MTLYCSSRVKTSTDIDACATFELSTPMRGKERILDDVVLHQSSKKMRFSPQINVIPSVDAKIITSKHIDTCATFEPDFIEGLFHSVEATKADDALRSLKLSEDTPIPNVDIIEMHKKCLDTSRILEMGGDILVPDVDINETNQNSVIWTTALSDFEHASKNIIIEEEINIDDNFVTIDATCTINTSNASAVPDESKDDPNIDSYKCGLCKKWFPEFFQLSRHNCKMASSTLTMMKPYLNREWKKDCAFSSTRIDLHTFLPTIDTSVI